MVKTQIQVPEEQYQALRNFAAAREWSIAETFRRGAELLMEVYPAQQPDSEDTWQPPHSAGVGWKGLDAKQLKKILTEDADPELAGRT